MFKNDQKVSGLLALFLRVLSMLLQLFHTSSVEIKFQMDNTVPLGKVLHPIVREGRSL